MRRLAFFAPSVSLLAVVTSARVLLAPGRSGHFFTSVENGGTFSLHTSAEVCVVGDLADIDRHLCGGL